MNRLCLRIGQLLPILLCIFIRPTHGIDTTTDDGASGEDVVDAVIAKIGSFFGDDHGFLKRLAYVDTDFGNLTPKGSGGIWNVSDEDFKLTKDQRDLQGKYLQIQQKFNIKWRTNIIHVDLKKPLFSALALHLYLCIKHNSTLRDGFPNTIEKQAKFRSEYLTRNHTRFPSKSEFIKLVQDFEDQKERNKSTSNNVKMDFIVVLDASPRIGSHFYGSSKDAVSRIFRLFDKDIVRFGLIAFITEAEVRLRLDDKLPAELQNNLKGIDTSPPNYNGRAQTIAGIQAAYELFRNATPRPEARRVMLVITDGHSTPVGDTNGECPASDVKIAKNKTEGVTIYSFGFGFHPNIPELISIAEGSQEQVIIQNVTYGTDGILKFFRQMYNKIGSDNEIIALTFGQISDEKLGDQERRRYKYPRSKRSFNITLNISEGQVKAYYNLDGAPNTAWNAGQLENNVTICVPNRPIKESSPSTPDYNPNGLEVPDDYYNTDETQSEGNRESYLYILVVGSKPVNTYNKYNLRVEEVYKIPSHPSTTPRE